MSIRFKVILPYLLLTLMVAATGAYVVTRLVSNSLTERLNNQLLEAGRVVSGQLKGACVLLLDCSAGPRVHGAGPDEQIVFAIYGKDGEHRARYADDRRVTLWSTREPLSAVVAMTLAGRGTAVTWGKPLTTAEIDAAPEPIASR